MSAPVLLRDLILGLSGLAIGLMFYLAFVSYRAWWRDHSARFDLSRGMMLTGVDLMVYLVTTEVVWRAPEIPVNWISVLYTLGGALVVIGALGMSVNWHHRKERS